MLNNSPSQGFWGCDLGTTNVSLARVTTGSEEVESYFVNFLAGLDPYEIHNIIKEFVWGLWIDPRDQFFVESVFMGLNVRTYSRMTRVAHSLYVVLKDVGCEVEFIDNNTWRKVLFSDAKVKKDHGVKWALEKFPQLGEYRRQERDHRADAACIASAGMKMRTGVIESQSPQSSGSRSN
jgi:hypothetical protein